MDYRFLAVARQSPCSLCRGDVEANLNRLLESSEPHTPVAAKIYKLLTVLHLNREKVKQAIHLMAEIPWHTAKAEQQHASASLIRKYHPDVTNDAMMEVSLSSCKWCEADPEAL